MNLHELKREDLTYVSELYFTVFYEDVNSNKPVGSFAIRNCLLEAMGVGSNDFKTEEFYKEWCAFPQKMKQHINGLKNCE